MPFDSKHIGLVSSISSRLIGSIIIIIFSSVLPPLLSPSHLQATEFDPSEPPFHFTSLTAHVARALWPARLNHGLLRPLINIQPGTQSLADPLPVRASLPLSCLCKVCTQLSPPPHHHPQPPGSLLTLCKQSDASSGIPVLTRPISRAPCLPNTHKLRWWLIFARCRLAQKLRKRRHAERKRPPFPSPPLPSLPLPLLSLPQITQRGEI